MDFAVGARWLLVGAKGAIGLRVGARWLLIGAAVAHSMHRHGIRICDHIV